MDFLDDDNEEESESYKLFGGKEGIVFLIDVTKAMFDTNCQQFSLAIQCVQNVMKNRAISNPSDELAVVLFGTDKLSNDHSFEHIFIVQKLQKTSAQTISDLKSLASDDFSSKLGHSNQFSLADVFTTAISQFTQSKSKFQTKRVIIFTCCPEPHSGNTPEAKHLRITAINRAKDFKDHSIDVELIPLASADKRVFDVETFYQDCFPNLKDDKCDTLTKLGQLLSRCFTRSYRQRMLASIPFRLGPSGKDTNDSTDVKMSVYVYSMYSEAKKPTAVTMTRKDFKEVKSSTQRWTQDVGAIVTPEMLSKKYQFGDSTVYMSKNDVKASKELEEPALTLLGFKPRDALLEHIQIKPAHFIYPNESSIKGSTTLFNALLIRCSQRNKVIICRLTLRRSSPPYLVALYPQMDNLEGFNVVYLPFKEDIREELPLKECQQLPIDSQVLDVAKNIVQKLSFTYETKNFPNPALQTFWRTIEALALDYEMIEPYDDSQTQPDYEDIESKAGYALYTLNQKLGGLSHNPMEKKVMDSTEMKQLAVNNKLGTLTVPILKAFCDKNGIKSGRKTECMEAIRLFFDIK